jgi:Zn-dependent peptidase ImmA (M78 family)/transcriptional regulator with XRE-family HTH domain
VPQSIPALVRPALLIWARESAGFTLEQAAEKVEIEPRTLKAWETGEDRPSIAQLRKVAAQYKRPLAVFFLAQPPEGFDAQREFRRLPGLTPKAESPELRSALRTALFRREAARDIYERLGERIPDCTIAIHPTDSEDVLVHRIRSALNITWDDQLNWPSQAQQYTAFNAWRSAIEAQGILVFQTGKVSIEEMRGTSMPDRPLPVILLNNKDAPVGRIFTLLHEFVHILLTNGGHRSSRMEGQRLPEDQYLERVSNRIAAAVLMPRQAFIALSRSFPGAISGSDESLSRFSKQIKVSAEAILRRLVEVKLARGALYKAKRHQWQQRPWHIPAPAGGGPPVEVQRLAEYGRPFASLVLEGYQRNVVSSSDVVDYLGVQLKYVSKVAQQLAPGPGAAAVA